MIIVGVLELLAVTPFVLRSGSRPICHVLIDGALQQWMLETGHTNDYPNAAGVGSNSLAMIQPFVGQEIQQCKIYSRIALGRSQRTCSDVHEIADSLHVAR